MKRKLLRICALLGAISLGVGAIAESVDLLEVDHRLYELGYRDSACSGELNDVMINALRNFQLANGLGITGEPDAGTILVLGSDAAVSQDDYLLRLSQQSAETPALAIGVSGEDVVRLQRALRELGYFDGNDDGAFGEGTVAAVRRFQLANGLEETGIADSATSMRLYSESPISWEDFLRNSAAGAGDSGTKVHALQYWLRCKGYFEGECTGRYGEDTQRAVRQFQSDVGLEASGDADQETCRALFTDIDALLADATALRRGAGSAETEALYRGLTALGYAAHERFDMQTELALMKFQRANELPVTGVADRETMIRLNAPNAVGLAGFVASGAEAALEEGFAARIARHASRLLGQMSNFDDSFDLVQYVYLQCGVAVANRAQFTPAGTELDETAAGDLMVLEIDGEELCGIAALDGGIIYCAEDGRIVMSYPGTMNAESVRLYRVATQ